MVTVSDVHPSLRARAEAVRRQWKLPGWLLGASMAAAIAFVAALAYWDEERESAAALEDFAREQAALANGVALSVKSRLATISERAMHVARTSEIPAQGYHEPDFDIYLEAEGTLPRAVPENHVSAAIPWDGERRLAVAVSLERMLSALEPVEHAGNARVVLEQPLRRGLLSTRGRATNLAALQGAFGSGATTARLSRAEASLLGLPERTAMAGLASVDGGPLGTWGIAVVSSAQKERDREMHAKWRLLLAVLVASGLVLAFGGVALRKQRQELVLSHELAVAAVQRARDERLVQADKLATLGALATGIAHEVSTPLGVILGRAEQLAPRVSGDERAKHAVAAITAQTERISRVIRGFLTLARGDAPRLEHVAPKRLALASIELVEHRFSSAEVQLAADVPDDIPKIACEPRLFEQVLVNLLLNACDACEPGGRVELAVRCDGSRVAFVVSDDGYGIAPEAASHATEPFFTTKQEGKGTGLGLAIANEIVKHHNGVLAITPREQGTANIRGTRAVVEIPVQTT